MTANTTQLTVVQFKKHKVAYWINDQKSVTENMAIFTKAFQIEFEGVLK